ncbi:BT_3987 domain-containing protein [Phocaeicola sp. HCN-6420]|jgi:hypothetical protein|uniref:BT_3987 domain-containing protein n=1 Tax=Phocaeicola sp. HCN-6420 TaxID=3134673 RepID=UPI0030C0161C
MKSKFKYLILGALISCCGLTSCNDDDEMNANSNFVFMYTPATTEYNLVYKIDGSFEVGMNEEATLVPIQCNRPAASDITVNVSIDDQNLVDEYNQKHGTSYVMLKNARLEESTLTIKQGEYATSSPLKVIYDMEEFKNGSTYFILPVSIASINGEGVSLSETHTFYILFESNITLVEYNEITNTSTPDLPYTLGEKLDASSWKYYLDGKETTINPYGGTSVENKELVIDMGKLEQVGTVFMRYQTTSRAAKNVDIACSTDGINYTNLGTVTITGTNRHMCYIHLLKTEPVQYIKIINRGNYGSACKILKAELYAPGE